MSTPDVTRLLENIGAGDRHSQNELFTIVYEQLRILADRQMQQESPEHTLQPTALVHEVWLKLLGGRGREPGHWNDRTHFFAAAAQAMRQILVDAARTRKRLKRGGDNAKVELREDDLLTRQDEDLIALDEALALLREKDPAKAMLVDLRYFAGLTNAQAADHLEISTATAERYWAFARAWLRRIIDDQQ